MWSLRWKPSESQTQIKRLGCFVRSDSNSLQWEINKKILAFLNFVSSFVQHWIFDVVQCGVCNVQRTTIPISIPMFMFRWKNFALLFVCNQAMRRYSHSCLQTANSSGSTCSAHKYTHTNLKTKKHQTKGIQITLATFDKNLMVFLLSTLTMSSNCHCDGLSRVTKILCCLECFTVFY